MQRLGIGTKLTIAVVLTTLSFLLLVALALNFIYDVMIEDRRDKIRNLVESAYAITAHFQQQVAEGVLPLDDAKARAAEALRAIQFGDKDYVFVLDPQGALVVHGGDRTLEGKNLYDVTDPNGVYLVRDLLAAARNTVDGGFSAYQWPRAGDATEKPVDKLSFALRFAPWDWTISTGIYIDDVQKIFWVKTFSFGSLALVLILLAWGVMLLLRREIVAPIHRLVKELARMSEGRLEEAVARTERQDEIGELARGLELFRQRSLENKHLESEQERQRGQAVNEKQLALARLADQMEEKIGGVAQNMVQAIATLRHQANDLETVAQSFDRDFRTVSHTTQQTTQNVETVAAATEELNASSSEIGRQVSHAADIAREAADEAERTNSVVLGLADAAQRIGDVVKMISDIAAQTNLLALNATIEAARAGDAGKGFAVVAGEVKSLAGQTAKATEDIVTQVGAVRNETDEAVTAIGRIGTTIKRVHETSIAIASAIEEQHAAIQEITRNVQDAARGAQEVASTIGNVSTGAQRTLTATNEVSTVTSALDEQSDSLRKAVRGFAADVRSQAKGTTTL